MSLRLFFLTCTVVATQAAFAQYVVRGEFNGWGNNGDLVMNDMGGGLWSATATGLTPGQGYEFKCTTTDWAFNGPNSNARTVANAAGEITFNFMPNTSWADGWQPANDKRVGWADSGLFGWELMGTVNNWGGAFLSLTNMGNGLYQGDMLVAAGDYEFKFRRENDWGYSVGSDFGNSASNATFSSDGVNTTRFQLDLPNGRWRTEVVPEPVSMIALGASLAALARRRRA
ncbi:MAG: PEP-CTERM sorting domain-containing protein [Armatimonadetes bacterium]|nr:PEP-CTERM sorting domain-containing protein [Armatimonadota bacterium]